MYSVFAGIVGVVLIRVLLKLVGALPTNEFAQFWYDFSKIFVEPWAVIYPSIAIGDRSSIEIYSIIAMLFYMIIASILAKSASSVFEDSRKEFIIAIVDSLFKAAEFLLISRFIFKLTNASTTASFVTFIYDYSAVVYEPFANILPATQIGDVTIEISTILALIIIIILDIITEQFLISLMDTVIPDPPRRSPSPARKQAPANYQQATQTPLQPAGYAQDRPAQNININIPQQPPNAFYDNRTVNVRPTPQPKPQRKGLLSYPKKRSSRAGGPATS